MYITSDFDNAHYEIRLILPNDEIVQIGCKGQIYIPACSSKVIIKNYPYTVISVETRYDFRDFTSNEINISIEVYLEKYHTS